MVVCKRYHAKGLEVTQKFTFHQKHGNKMKDFKKLTRWVPFLQLIYLLYLVFTLLCCTSLKILSSLDDDDDENDNDDRDDDGNLICIILAG